MLDAAFVRLLSILQFTCFQLLLHPLLLLLYKSCNFTFIPAGTVNEHTSTNTDVLGNGMCSISLITNVCSDGVLKCAIIEVTEYFM